MIWSALISPIASLAGTFLEGQVSKSKAKAQLVQTEAEAKSEVMKNAAMHDSKWELIMAESTKHGWKDEVVTIIVLAPCVMAWIDPELAKRGFDVISEMPTWYQGAVLGVISAAIGLRGFDKFRKK